MELESNLIDQIEGEIEVLLEEYLDTKNQKYWDSQVLKLKNKKNLSLIRPKLFLDKNPYLFSPEQFAHYYSILSLPDISFIDKIVFLPKFIETEHYFLTNLYIKKYKIFLFYLAPIKIFLSSLSLNEIYKKNRIIQDLSMDRIVLKEKYSTKFQNLFYVLELLNRQDFSSNINFYKFIEEKQKLNYKELEDMRLIHDFFLLKHPLNKN
jgi:hypothetical protein